MFIFSQMSVFVYDVVVKYPIQEVHVIYNASFSLPLSRVFSNTRRTHC
jgi:hypothetical protein